jgi:hypothetical protein
MNYSTTSKPNCSHSIDRLHTLLNDRPKSILHSSHSIAATQAKASNSDKSAGMIGS